MMNPAESVSPTRAAFRRLVRNKPAVSAMVFLIALLVLCLAGPSFSAYGENHTDLEYKARQSSAAHWFGTDTLGRDVATRVLCGGRVSLAVGLAATLVSLVIGVTYGTVSGLAGGRLDAFLMRVVDVLYAFPFMIFVIILTVMFGRSIVLLFAAIGAVEWLTMARIVRGQVMGLMKQDFVTAARANGAGWSHIMLRHLIPNILGPVIVYASLTVPSVMILEATLSFLGLGVQPPFASWGSLILDGSNSMETYPWLLLFPAAFFSATLLALNFLGDGLRDALDPKSVR